MVDALGLDLVIQCRHIIQELRRWDGAIELRGRQRRAANSLNRIDYMLWRLDGDAVANAIARVEPLTG